MTDTISCGSRSRKFVHGRTHTPPARPATRVKVESRMMGFAPSLARWCLQVPLPVPRAFDWRSKPDGRTTSGLASRAHPSSYRRTYDITATFEHPQRAFSLRSDVQLMGVRVVENLGPFRFRVDGALSALSASGSRWRAPMLGVCDPYGSEWAFVCPRLRLGMPRSRVPGCCTRNCSCCRFTDGAVLSEGLPALRNACCTRSAVVTLINSAL